MQKRSESQYCQVDHHLKAEVRVPGCSKIRIPPALYRMLCLIQFIVKVGSDVKRYEHVVNDQAHSGNERCPVPLLAHISEAQEVYEQLSS